MSTLSSPLINVTPPSQKNRPIALVISDGGAISWMHVFLPRPEEVTFVHPTRAAVNQTFDGAWVDDFGQGVVEINISGHTGWRGANLMLANVPGEVQAYNLRNAVMNTYHSLRESRARAAQDPDLVEMLFIDTLNLCGYVVYPTSFQLRRHKSRPLLYQYQIKLTALNEFYVLENLVGDTGDLFSNFNQEFEGLLGEFASTSGELFGGGM